MYKVIVKKGEEWFKISFLDRDTAKAVADMADWLGATETEITEEDDAQEE